MITASDGRVISESDELDAILPADGKVRYQVSIL